MTSKIFLSLITGFALCSSTLLASESDTLWEELKPYSEPYSMSYPQGWSEKEPSAEELAQWRKERHSEWSALANKAAAFTKRFPNDPRAVDILKAEMMLLHLMGVAGDKAAEEKAKKLYTQFAKRENASEEDRYNTRFTELLRPGLDPAAEVAAVRQLQKEFPHYQHPHFTSESLLLNAAERMEEADCRKLVTEVLAQNPSEYAQQRAKEVLARYDRIGQPFELKYPALDGGAIDTTKDKGKVILLHFWNESPESKAQTETVKEVLKRFDGSQLSIVGIPSPKSSWKADLQALVTAEGITWPQAFERWNSGRLASEYRVYSSTIWLVGKDGILRSVDARRDTLKKVEQLINDAAQ